MQVTSLTVAIAAYNEEAMIQQVTEESIAILRRLCDDFEVLIINDCSTDRTGEIINTLAKKFPNDLRVIHRKQNEGMAKTYLDLHKSGCKDYSLVLDGDGQYPPKSIENVLPLLQTYDVIIGVREEDIRGTWRKLISWTYATVTHVFFGIDCPDTRGVRCYSRKVIECVPIRSSSIFADVERVILAARSGYRIGNVSVPMNKREEGVETGAHLRLILQTIWDMMKFRVRLLTEKTSQVASKADSVYIAM